MDAGAFSKPCAFVASVHSRWNEDPDQPKIVGLNLTTTAYALRDRWRKQPDREYPEPAFVNRPQDLEWALAKIRLLFAAAGVPLPPVHTTTE